jgi:hypothetical protein
MSELFIFRTNISSQSDFLRLKKRLERIFSVMECTIDLEDVDRVLRVECAGVNATGIETEVERLGFQCSELE